MTLFLSLMELALGAALGSSAGAAWPLGAGYLAPAPPKGPAAGNVNVPTRASP